MVLELAAAILCSLALNAAIREKRAFCYLPAKGQSQR